MFGLFKKKKPPEYDPKSFLSEDGELIFADDYDYSDEEPQKKKNDDLTKQIEMLTQKLKDTVDSYNTTIAAMKEAHLKEIYDINLNTQKQIYNSMIESNKNARDQDHKYWQMLEDKNQIQQDYDRLSKNLAFASDALTLARQDIVKKESRIASLEEHISMLKNEIDSIDVNSFDNTDRIEHVFAESMNYMMYVREDGKNEFINYLNHIQSIEKDLEDLDNEPLFLQNNYRWHVYQNQKVDVKFVTDDMLQLLIDNADENLKYNDPIVIFITYKTGQYFIENLYRSLTTIKTNYNNQIHHVLYTIRKIPCQIIQPSALTQKYPVIIASYNYCAGINTEGVIEKIEMTNGVKTRLGLSDSIRPESTVSLEIKAY